MRFRSALVLFLSFLLVGCSARSKIPKKQYVVTVEANGVKTNGNTGELVHRINLKKNDINFIFGTGAKPKIPFSVTDISKANNAIGGLKVQETSKVTEILKLKKGDILTSIEGKLISGPADLSQFAKYLGKSKEVGFSFQRKGTVMKSIVYQVP